MKEKLSPADFNVEDLFNAYFDCRKCKRNKMSQLAFEADLETNIMDLYYDLKNGDYHIGRSIAFVVQYPKIREIWAADFRDRVVHHLVYNAVKDFYYRRFIRDSYACIPGRGTHDGLRRVSGFARSITRNYTRPAYVLKIDIANFFNTIDCGILDDMLCRSIGAGWCQDLTKQIIWHDPRDGAVFQSSRRLFEQVPPHKSLLKSLPHKGLPIGNVTSQFFANVYLDALDKFVKHDLKCRYYGRYVDDMVLFHDDPAILNQWRAQIDGFLRERLALHLHPHKIWMNRVDKGVDFVGFIIKPGRVYMRRHSLNRCKQTIRAWEKKGAPIEPVALSDLSKSMNSYLGMLRQVNGYNMRRALCGRVQNLFLQSGADFTKLVIVPASSS